MNLRGQPAPGRVATGALWRLRMGDGCRLGAAGHEAPANVSDLPPSSRTILKSQSSVENEQFFRLTTREAHPLGNLAILRESADTRVVEEAVAPSLGVSQPTAVLFVAGLSGAIAGQFTAHGFSQLDPMPAMAADIAALVATVPPEGCELLTMVSAEKGTALADVLCVADPDRFDLDMVEELRPSLFLDGSPLWIGS